MVAIRPRHRGPLTERADRTSRQVFYHQMKGDYHRYLAEFASGEARTKAAEEAHESYKAASAIAASELAPTRASRPACPARLLCAYSFF